MSLRVRLIAAISALLIAALTVGGMLSCWRAFNSVQTEMRGAMTGARGVVREALGRHGDDVTPAFVSDLVLSFNGQRHVLAAEVLPAGATVVRSHTIAPDDAPPRWFQRLIGVRSQTIRLALRAPRGAALTLSTDPTNEIAEVWSQTRDAFGALLLFCVCVCAAIYAIVGHWWRRFSVFEAAFTQIAEGRYEAALQERGPPELVSLARGFNHMAGRIRDFRQRNVELREQLLTLQEEERAEIARDLHDEVGPYLFAINVDAGDIPQLLRANDPAEAALRASAIRDAAMHIQKHVRAILRQLRPNDALDFGLHAAICDLVAFWTRRCPQMRFDVECDLGGVAIDRRIEDAAYRLVQESLSNAVRHGRPRTITVKVVRRPDDLLSIAVADDGSGLSASAGRSGMGVSGMAERVRALHGKFQFDGVAGVEGACTRALLPLRDPRPSLPMIAP
jgi:two-component system sensor histidine kinase UhpB